MSREKSHQRTEMTRKRYGVCKWQYDQLDCIDLYIELLILLNCELIDRCQPCRHFLTFVLDCFKIKWDDIKFIEFEKALKLAKSIKWIMV